MNTFCGVDPPPVSSLPASSQIILEVRLEKGSPVWGFNLQHKTEYLGNKMNQKINHRLNLQHESGINI